jgi:hypothetical protein
MVEKRAGRNEAVGQSNPLQSALVQNVFACAVTVLVTQAHRDFLWINGRMVDRTGTCADNAIEHDRQIGPRAWLKL